MSTETMSATTEVPTTCEAEFKRFCGLFSTATDDWKRKIVAHVRATTGRTTPIPVYHRDPAVTDDQKIELYQSCISALSTKNAEFLQGQVASGDKRAEPAVEPAPEPAPVVKPKPAPPQPKPVAVVEDAEPEEPMAAAFRALVAASKAKADPELGKRLGFMESTLAGMESRLSKIPTDETIKKVVSHCLGNGEFPTARVEKIAQEIADARFKASPASVVPDLDSEIKPRINDLLNAAVKDLLKSGPAALVTRTPKPVKLASEVPDKNHPDIKTYVVDAGLASMLKGTYIRSREKFGENLLLIGPHGCGKSSLPMWLAAEYGMPLLFVDMANTREPRDLFGMKTVSGGDIGWQRSQFDMCLEAGNHVIVLDEISRCSDAVRNILFPLLDHRRQTWLEERGEFVRVGKGTIFAGTINIGFQYTGSSVVDAALDDRFVRKIEVSYLPLEKEADVLVKRTGISRADALKLAEVAESVRKSAMGHGGSAPTLTRTISTRQLVEAAVDFKMSGPSSLRYTISNHFTAEGGGESERQQILLILQGKFGTI